MIDFQMEFGGAAHTFPPGLHFICIFEQLARLSEGRVQVR